jgi:hypothetical protein
MARRPIFPSTSAHHTCTVQCPLDVPQPTTTPVARHSRNGEIARSLIDPSEIEFDQRGLCETAGMTGILMGFTERRR